MLLFKALFITSFRISFSEIDEGEMKCVLTLLDLPGIVFSVLIAIWMGYNGWRFGFSSFVLINRVNTIYWTFIKWRPWFIF
jgi:hypothetical protein